MKDNLVSLLPIVAWKLELKKGVYLNKSKAIFTLKVKKVGGDQNNMINIHKGENYPLAVQIISDTAEYNDFSILEDECYVRVYNSLGKLIDPSKIKGSIKPDNANHTIFFQWLTGAVDDDGRSLAPGLYSVVVWCVFQYKGSQYKLATDSIDCNLYESVTVVN